MGGVKCGMMTPVSAGSASYGRDPWVVASYTCCGISSAAQRYVDVHCSFDVLCCPASGTAVRGERLARCSERGATALLGACAAGSRSLSMALRTPCATLVARRCFG